MAFIAQFRGKKRLIVERSFRGEAPPDIAVAVDTTLPYVYNVRAEAKRLGIEFPQTVAPIAQNPVNPATDAHQVPVQNQPAVIHDARNMNQAETIDQDNADVMARIREQERRAQRRRLLAREEQLKALEEEDQLQTSIADITRDPSELLRNKVKYVQAMSTIVHIPPWYDRFIAVADFVSDDRLNIMIGRHYARLSAEGKLGFSPNPSETPLRDLVNDFIVFARNFEVDASANAVAVRAQLRASGL